MAYPTGTGSSTLRRLWTFVMHTARARAEAALILAAKLESRRGQTVRLTAESAALAALALRSLANDMHILARLEDIDRFRVEIWPMAGRPPQLVVVSSRLGPAKAALEALAQEQPQYEITVRHMASVHGRYDSAKKIPSI